MAVLEIQANGDAAVSKEAITNAGQSLEDPLMRVSLNDAPCPRYTLERRPVSIKSDTDSLFIFVSCLTLPYYKEYAPPSLYFSSHAPCNIILMICIFSICCVSNPQC